jgi:hypothetical protein
MAIDPAPHIADVKKYAKKVDDAAVEGIIRYLGIAMRSKDASLVSGSDKTERDRVRDKFLKKKLALTDSDDKLDKALGEVLDAMKADKTKSRVTVYYLLAEKYGKLSLFIKKAA